MSRRGVRELDWEEQTDHLSGYGSGSRTASLAALEEQAVQSLRLPMTISMNTFHCTRSYPPPGQHSAVSYESILLLEVRVQALSSDPMPCGKSTRY
jgi:hypothetical protein